MKQLKYKLLTIVLLLNCFISYCQNYNNDCPSTGGEIVADTTISIKISDIRKINKALIERKYYKNMLYVQDSIISLKENYIAEQDDIICDMQDRIIKTTEINNKLLEDYKKQKKKTIIASSIAGGLGICFVGIVTGLILTK